MTPLGSEARIRGWVWAMTPAGSQSIGTMFRDLMWSEARIRGWVWAMTPAGSQSIGTMLCDPAGVRSTHSWLGLGRDPSGVTEHRNDRRTKVFDPPYGGSQRRRDSPGNSTEPRSASSYLKRSCLSRVIDDRFSVYHEPFSPRQLDQLLQGLRVLRQFAQAGHSK